ncbi:MAG: cell wall hydrolase [Butyrivibrio sp.]|nr:cell wall hydrolase [Butyrivibrio sp.]
MTKAVGFSLKVLGLGMACSLMFNTSVMTLDARENRVLTSMSVGVGNIINPTDSLVKDVTSDSEEVVISESENEEVTIEEKESNLVMANVSSAMNIRLEPNEDSDKTGVLYKDCGGRILEQKDGWTKIESGDLVGWAKDEYLLFGEDAKALAAEVGVELVTSTTDALRIRKEADENAEVLAVLTDHSFVDFVEDLGNGWISVDYNDETGYVKAEYVTTDFRIDNGETMEAIEEREAELEAQKEAERQAELKKNRGAVEAGADEVKLLAALIQCEAGNQSYEGKVAVGAVVMNRVKSGAYANNIQGVIYASGQFTPALNGTVDRVYLSGNIASSCVEAAQAAINGETTVGGCTHFRRAGGHDGQVIGAHVFW